MRNVFISKFLIYCFWNHKFFMIWKGIFPIEILMPKYSLVYLYFFTNIIQEIFVDLFYGKILNRIWWLILIKSIHDFLFCYWGIKYMMLVDSILVLTRFWKLIITRYCWLSILNPNIKNYQNGCWNQQILWESKSTCFLINNLIEY
jgi:hypothetical protein